MSKSIYERVLDLRNRISLDGDDTIYEEDYLLLDEVLDYIENYEQKVQDRDLKPYKTPHERLLELGWRLTHEGEDFIFYGKSFSTMLQFSKKDVNYSIDEKNIDLELAEILVDYLKELENE